MAFIPTPNTVRCAFEFEINAQENVITLWFEGEVAFDVDALIALGTALIDWLGDNVMPLLVSSLVFNGVRLTAQDSVSAPSIFLPPTAPIPGGIAQPPLSTQVAYVVGFDTDLRGRSYRGRNYLPGIPEGDQVAPGVTNAAAAGGFVAAYAALAAVETSQNVTHVVTSHFNGGLARAAGVNTEVTGYRGDLAFDTQRRRSVGRGA